MSSIGDSILLSQLSIPGTHDSGALYESVSGTAICQDLTIAEQLNAGVRFLDIRCRHYGDSFVIHHGSVYQNLNFDDVLDACSSFLSSNPDECIIMSVKEEYDSYNITQTFAETFNDYVAQDSGLWYFTTTAPALGACRGKIVLVRRFSGSVGINAYSSWSDNTTFTCGILRVQDCYQVSYWTNDNKIAAIESLFDEALAGSSSMFYLNFTSGYRSFLGIPDIPGVADEVNEWLEDYFGDDICNRYGVVIMDFANATRCSLIYNSNIIGTKKIVNVSSGRAMDAYGNSNGSNVIIYDYWSNTNQKWLINYLGSSCFSIRSAQSGNLSADVWNWGTVNGTNIALYSYWGGNSQKYLMQSVGDGYYRITPYIASAQCLDAYGTANESNVGTWSYWGGTNQQWIVQNP
ncbi:phosphatidylinositol-specific phospholipase C domain-containing protein [Candidatus Sumerlaeota bacterium]|nr:phosphatidylinositol-specific phospholipase C domain-containing protein [Candidatus Sumerlaeota bacterium]